LWQVQAAALALSLAVVIFVFEAVYSARPRPSIRDLAEGVGLPAIFYAGLIGLGLTGMVLLGVGSGAPGGWAATWAVLWAALSGAMLIRLFVVMLRDIEPDALYARWLARLHARVIETIDGEIFERIAGNLLSDECARVGVKFEPLFGGLDESQLVDVPASRGGIVRDVNLHRIAKAGRLSVELDVGRANGKESPAVFVYLGSRVAEGQSVMRVARVVGNLVPLRGAFNVVKPDSGIALDAGLTELHDEAIRLIREGSPGAYSRINEVYEELLLAPPVTWSRYGERFGHEAARGMHLFQFTLLDRVERRLREELELAVLSPSREIGHDALNLPLSVAFRTIDLRAIGLAARMLQLLVAVQHALIRSPSGDQRTALLSGSWLRLSEYGRAVENLVRSDKAHADDRDHGATALRQVFDALAHIAKGFIDHNPREEWAFSELNRYLTEPLRHWEPEYMRPAEWEVELLEEREDTDPVELGRLRAAAAKNAALVRVKDDLELWRDAQRFALLWWSMRRLRDTGDSAFVEAWNAFSGFFSDVGRTARIADLAIESEFHHRSQWSNWYLSELTPGEAHFVNVDGEFVQTFVAVALGRMDPDAPAPDLGLLPSLAGRTRDARQAVDAVIGNENLRPLLPEDRLEERAERLVQALEAINRAREMEDEQRTIDAALNPDLVDEYRRKVRDTWLAHRLVGPLLRTAGQYETLEGDAPESARWGFRPELVLKGLFIDEPHVHGADWQAVDLGRGLAEGETSRLVETAAAQSPEFEPEDGASLAQTLRSAIAELGDEPDDIIVLTHQDWRLVQALELTPAHHRGGEAATPDWLPEDAGREWFLGRADGAPVFGSHLLPPETVVVLAPARFVRWRQWKVQDGHEIHVSIDAHDEAAAHALAVEHEGLFRTDERTTVEARAREVRRTVLRDVFERYELEVLDPGAARWIAVPENLRNP